MCSAHCLMVLYICVKFPENITNGIRVMERTQIYDALTNRRRTDTQNFRVYNVIPCHFLWQGIKSMGIIFFICLPLQFWITVLGLSTYLLILMKIYEHTRNVLPASCFLSFVTGPTLHSIVAYECGIVVCKYIKIT